VNDELKMAKKFTLRKSDKHELAVEGYVINLSIAKYILHCFLEVRLHVGFLFASDKEYKKRVYYVSAL